MRCSLAAPRAGLLAALAALVAIAVLACARRAAVVEAPMVSADASAVALASAGAASAASRPPTDLPYAMGDRLVGHYYCLQGRTRVTLLIDQVDGNELDATFEFDFPGGRGTPQASGSYRMHGSFDPGTRRLWLEHQDWVDAPPSATHRMVDLVGTVSKTGSYSGTIPDRTDRRQCTTFSVSPDSRGR